MDVLFFCVGLALYTASYWFIDNGKVRIAACYAVLGVTVMVIASHGRAGL